MSPGPSPGTLVDMPLTTLKFPSFPTKVARKWHDSYVRILISRYPQHVFAPVSISAPTSSSIRFDGARPSRGLRRFSAAGLRSLRRSGFGFPERPPLSDEDVFAGHRS